MRAPLIAALLAPLAVAGLLAYGYWSRGAPGKRPGASGVPPEEAPLRPPAPMADVERLARARPRDPGTQDGLRRFVEDCVARGPAAVPELLALLKNRPDVTLLPLWRFREGRPDGDYPTLRSAYIDALASIPGEEAAHALREVLDLTGSVEETFQIAAALAQRDEGGWLAAAVDRADRAQEPPARTTQWSIVELAASFDPAGAASLLLARAPRGEDAADPQVMARALRALPLDTAVATARQVFADPDVTWKAKERYLDEFCEREESMAFTHLREIVRDGSLDATQRYAVASRAVRAGGFFRDRIGRETALAAGDSAEEQRLRTRYLQRLEEVAGIVEAAVSEMEDTDPRALNLRRALERHREAVR